MKNNLNKYVDCTLSFFEKHFVDYEYGGIYAAVDGETVTTDDKEIYSHGMAMAALQRMADKRSLKGTLNHILNDRFEKEGCRFSEVTDRFYRAHGTGLLVRPNHRVLWLASRYICADLLEKLEIKDQLKTSLENCVQQLQAFRIIPTVISEDWKRPLSAEAHLQVYADLLFALFLLKSESNLEFLESFETRLLSDIVYFIDDLAAVEILAIDGTVQSDSGRRLTSMAQLSYVLLGMANKTIASTYTHQLAENMLSFILKYMHNDIQGGYWHTSGIDGSVQVTPATSCVQSNSPFPVILAEGQAWLFLALNKLSDKNEKYGQHATAAFKEMMMFYDEKSGGFFEGQGFWFASPKDPVIPFGRWYWVNRHTVGAFHVGNISYKPLHLKLALTQSICIIALNEAMDSKWVLYDEANNSREELLWEPLKTPMKRELISYIKDLSILPEYEKYKEWLHKTSNRNGFGLTAYRSPLGFRADRCSQLFSTFHVLADLYAMGDIHSLDKQGIIYAINACQNEDGGFGELPGHPSDVFATYCGAVSLRILETVPNHKEACVGYLQSAQNSDGGFGNSPGLTSDTWHTNLAVAALEAMGMEPRDKECCIQFLLRCRNEDGSYGLRPGLPPEPYSAFRAISALLLMGVEVEIPEKTVAWLHACETEHGSYRIRPNSVESFVATYHAIAALYLLGAKPISGESVKRWLVDHQIEDGGFSRSGQGPSDTTDEGFICLHAALMIEDKLEPYWAALIS